ncbi:MAG: DNA-binding transcriptional regulator [Verrucomicrobia bacterium]|nr:DNA-binding transcriptional regulator [Verrucomicrobiota bacterium]
MVKYKIERKGASPVLRIALLLGQDLGYCRGVLKGILAHHPDDTPWQHRDSAPDIQVIPSLKKWNPDGIIAHIFDPSVAEALGRFNGPIVNTTDTLKGFDFPLVEVNNLAVGTQAANYFLSKGFINYGYFGSSWAHFSLRREKGFREELGRHGFTVSTCNAEFLPRPSFKQIWNTADKNIVEWLCALPKPCAILASNDIPARHLTELCNELNLRVPGDIAILGVDNDEAECQMSSPALSSIELPTRLIGLQAAEMLEQLIRGELPNNRHIKIDPLRIIERGSTDTETHTDPMITKLIDLITQSADDDPGVDALARACGVSRRLLEKKVSSTLGTTILGLVQQQQVKMAKNLLLDYYLPIGQIAEKCGLGSQRRLNEVFMKKTGTNPSGFRKKHLSPYLGSGT